YSHPNLRHPHSFPTRRSSDLADYCRGRPLVAAARKIVARQMRTHRTMRKTWHQNALIFVVILVPVSFFGNAGSRRDGWLAPQNDQVTVLVGAGDIADCRNLAGAEATAKLLDRISGTVMAVGDLAYPDGSTGNFVCYDKTWGRARLRTRPAPGNHEFHSSRATPYFDYFGVFAGDEK